MERIFMTLLLLVISNLTPAIRESLVSLLKTLEADAKKTPNPWDDIFVAILKMLLLVETTDPADIVKPGGE